MAAGWAGRAALAARWPTTGDADEAAVLEGPSRHRKRVQGAAVEVEAEAGEEEEEGEAAEVVAAAAATTDVTVQRPPRASLVAAASPAVTTRSPAAVRAARVWVARWA